MSGAVFSVISTFLRQHTDWFTIIGILYASSLTLRAALAIWRGWKSYFLAPILGLGTDLASLGSWAVVTGSTDGIGRAYAEELAKKGLNVVLISRSIDKLKDVAQAIEKDNPSVKTKCVAIDFSEGHDIYARIASELQGLDIALLVNNVGVGYEFPEYLTDVSDKDIQTIIKVNCNSVTFMTKLVLPEMVKRKKGLIINISSQSGVFPVPMLTVYSATKAYVEFFSSGVADEYKSKGIMVQCVAPGFVATKLSKIRHASFFVPDPNKYVRSALATAGIDSNTSGCFAHSIVLFLVSTLPKWITSKISMSMMQSARSKGRSKKGKTQ